MVTGQRLQLAHAGARTKHVHFSATAPSKAGGPPHVIGSHCSSCDRVLYFTLCTVRELLRNVEEGAINRDAPWLESDDVCLSDRHIFGSAAGIECSSRVRHLVSEMIHQTNISVSELCFGWAVTTCRQILDHDSLCA